MENTPQLPTPEGNIFKYSLHIEAGTPQEANAIMEALVKLYYCLSNDDLAKLAELVQTRPDLVAQAKTLL
jgi:hypothetical protein